MGGRSPGFAMDYEELLGRGSSKEPVSDLVEEDEAFLMFTGGTTGKPKGQYSRTRAYSGTSSA